jgi:plastocyanin
MPQQPPSNPVSAVRLVIVATAVLVAVAGTTGWLLSAAHSIAPAMSTQSMDHAAMSPAVKQVVAAPNEVVIDNFSFAPKTLTVAAGTEVVWINRDDEPHTVVSSGEAKLFKSPALDTDDKFSFVFKEPGTYSYYCSVHPHMTATIVVR